MPSAMTRHDEIVEMIAVLSVANHDLTVMASVLGRAGAMLSAVGGKLVDVCETFGVRPTREEILEAVQRLKAVMGSTPTRADEESATPPDLDA